MRKTFLLLITVGALCLNAMSQTTTEANPADVSTLDGIMKAVYDVISGDAGKPRNWDRFRTLFHKDARMIPTNTNPQTKEVRANVLMPEDYIKRVEPFFAKEGFYEREKARRVEQFGHIAQVFSTYESFHSLTDKQPFARGINSFQLFNDGKRWWVVTIYWQQETSEFPIPQEFLTTKN